MKKYLITFLVFLILVSCNNRTEDAAIDDVDTIVLEAPLLREVTLKNINLRANINSSGTVSVLFENSTNIKETPDMSDMIIKVNGQGIELMKNSTNHFYKNNFLNLTAGETITFTVEYNGVNIITEECKTPESLTNVSISTDPSTLNMSPLSIKEFIIDCDKISDYVYYSIEFFENINDISPTDFYSTLSSNSINITKDKYRYGSYYDCDYIDITVYTVNSVSLESSPFSINSTLLVDGLTQITKSNRS